MVEVINNRDNVSNKIVTYEEENMKYFIKERLKELRYIIYNYFVCYIPFWPLRKMFYLVGGMKIGKHSRILMKTIVVSPSSITIGERSIINEMCMLDGRANLFIGDDVSISIFTHLITGSHNMSSNDFEYSGAPIYISKNVWIGASSTILGGSILHEGCVIGAGSTVIRGEYLHNGVYSGVPAIYVKKRELESGYKLGIWKPWFR